MKREVKNARERESDSVEYEFILLKDFNDKEIGQVSVQVFLQPYRFAYIADIEIYKDYRGKGYGRGVIQQINNWLIKHKLTGLLVDSVESNSSNSSEVYNLYHRYGWKVFERKVFTFNDLNLNVQDKLNMLNILNS